MTLSPVFRSSSAVEALTSKGYLESLSASIEAQRRYVQTVHRLLNEIIDGCYVAAEPPAADDLTFLQEHFFLVLFDSVYRCLGCPQERLETYGPLNVCIKGLVVAGDNLFDDESKMDLPLALGGGDRFASIMQLLCFDHLITAILDRCAPFVDAREAARYRRALLSALAAIGTLEGSEEGGVDAVLPVEQMIEKVHRVRGGKLFSLAFIAPGLWEPAAESGRWQAAQEGIARLGTAFQIVDDLTDFEFDMRRRSHNVLVAQITHHGTADEKRALARCSEEPGGFDGSVERAFVHSARAVLERARLEAQRGFERLKEVGFWFPPEDASLFVRAIAGDAGDARVQAVLPSASDR